LAPGRVPVCPGLFPFLMNALPAFPDLTGLGTLRLSGSLYRKEVPLGPGQAIGSGRLGAARPGAAWQAGFGLVRLGLLIPDPSPAGPALQASG
jgi:hypothetical protein